MYIYDFPGGSDGKASAYSAGDPAGSVCAGHAIIILSLIMTNRRVLGCFSHVRLCVTTRAEAHQPLCPRDSPGKKTGVGCRALLWGALSPPHWQAGP